MADSPMLKHALAYAKRGWPVFPLFGPKDRCPKDASPGKSPRTMKGFKDATCNAAQIRKWWDMWPTSNIGLATGKAFVVLDIDGVRAAQQIKAAGYETPDTLEVITGREGGRHMYLLGDASIRNRTKLIHGEPGVDIRGEGGYVVAPPSIHENGKVYEFSDPDVDMLPTPDWMRELHGARKLETVDTESAEPIPEKTRNDTLASIAGSYRAKGLGFADIFTLLQTANDTRCKPPLEDSEVRKIAKSISEYPVDDVVSVEPWGYSPEQLKQLGVDAGTIAKVAKVNEEVKQALPEPGSNATTLSLVRRWSNDSSEAYFVARLTTGTQTVVVQPLSGAKLMSFRIVAGLCLEQGMALPVMKGRDWRAMYLAALAERQDIEVGKEETVVGACVQVIMDWVRTRSPTTNWKDFPEARERCRIDEDDGAMVVSGQGLREHVSRSVRDAKRPDVSSALRKLNAADCRTPNKRHRMLRFRFDGAKVVG